ncbi:hypothetical protein DOTSEDRAFT_68104 [Dothistroma septosporum NZE10]|uniref:POPLD domain-containing protein n=1 Tax=Dothistroma septosporum (strain NZE10 / CBS 128990) TaxID=675120 RepID=N1Q3J6_DOTSN|nr:hypothetical protein DOTSEDRAFT_68104 [Dothistroma septosporum NZE10]
MAEHNTPAVTSRRRKLTRHMRLRVETAKRLRALGAQRRSDQETAITAGAPANIPVVNAIQIRAPKVKKATPAEPPTPKAKFRKRQKNKTWLPTHMFHAKRARMTPPKEPLWRFALPLTPTVKSHRPTHKAANERGAVAWDTSYVSTIGLEGQQRSIQGVLQALGVASKATTNEFAGVKGARWLNGSRVWEGMVCHREDPHRSLAPVTVIWCAFARDESPQTGIDTHKRRRSIFVRVHPAAFCELWDEIVRLSRVVKPHVLVEDLRFELGSIQIVGPGATEALHGVLWPSGFADNQTTSLLSVERTWAQLAGLSDPTMLPSGALLGFDILDPRLHHPPQTINLPHSSAYYDNMTELIAKWPLEVLQSSPLLFSRKFRLAASSSLPSQKAINRRKALARPGQYPSPLPTDPKIPVLLHASSNPANQNGAWTLILPWKCVRLVWHSILYYPLSTGGQPRFGGLDEMRQLAFEAGVPWFPADFPGTKAGWDWEMQERQKRKNQWLRRPKSKRVNWQSVDAGGGKKGEIGEGWACDWTRLLSGPLPDEPDKAADEPASTEPAKHDAESYRAAETAPQPEALMHMPLQQARSMWSSAASTASTLATGSVITVHIKFLTRGVPQTCARIYRLPSPTTSNDVRRSWLTLHPRNQPNAKRRGPKNGLPRLDKDAPAYLVQRRLAQCLVEPPRVGEEHYPECPGEDDLIGYVTSGNFNLGEGRGTGVGVILLKRVTEGGRASEEDSRLCIVRNAGSGIGRLAEWDLV